MSLVTCSPSVVAQMSIFRTTVTRFSLDIRDIGSLLGAFDEPLEDQNWLQERILQGKWPWAWYQHSWKEDGQCMV